MDTDGDILELATFLPYRMAVLSERMSKRMSTVYGERFGLTIAEWRVIAHLARCRCVSVRDIHNCVNLEKSRVSRAVSSLELAGLVYKAESERDHRLVDVSLSDKGWGVYREIVPIASAFEQSLLDTLTEDERNALDHVIERLNEVLDEDPNAPKRSRLDIRSR